MRARDAEWRTWTGVIVGSGARLAADLVVELLARVPEPSAITEAGERICILCRSVDKEHKPTCPWRMAREIAGVEGP